MLLLGRQKQQTCQGLSRRAFVQIGASSVLGLSLADLLRLRATAIISSLALRSNPDDGFPVQSGIDR